MRYLISEIFQSYGFQLVCHAILCNVNSKSLSTVMPNPGYNWVGTPSVTITSAKWKARLGRHSIEQVQCGASKREREY